MTPEEIRSLPFFWSCRRRRYFHQCRLRYFLHYYAARLGRFESCRDQLCYEAFLLDRKIPAVQFPRVVLCRTMHDMFQRYDHSPLHVRAVANLHKEIRNMLENPGTVQLVLAELADGTEHAADLVDRLAEEVQRAAVKIEEEFWDKIDLIPHFHRRFINRPQEVMFVELQCYFVPVLALNLHGEYWILESAATPEYADMVSCLHGLYVSNEAGMDPTRMRSLYLDEDYTVRQLSIPTSPSACIRQIQADLDQMLSAEMEGYVTVRDFPPSPGSVCGVCQFRSYCMRKGYLPCSGS